MGTTMTTTVDWMAVQPTAIVKQVLSDYGVKVLQAVKSAWPTDSGKSAGAWTSDVSVSGSTITLTLTNDSGYAGYITVKGSKTLAIDEVTREVIDRYLPTMAADIAKALAAAYSVPSPAKEVVSG